MDDHAPAPPRLAGRPTWLISQVARHGDRLVGEALARDSVRKHHFRVLVTLDDHGPSSQADIGRALSIDRSDLHAVLNTLERDELVRRTPDAHDRRRNLVELTPAGRRVLRRLDTRVQKAQDELLAPLDEDERAQLTELLRRVDAHHAPTTTARTA
jgi:DNA-binding MarR family transcriptional regulator